MDGHGSPGVPKLEDRTPILTYRAPDEASGPTDHRAALWLPLLRRLTERVPRWVVLKNAGAALAGVGDVDSFASPEDWPLIEREFRAWAAERDLPMVAVCRHIWRGPHFVAIDPASPYLLVLDVKSYRTFRGSALIRLGDAVAFAELDPLGFRRLRSGPEGVVKLLWNGMFRGARRNEVGLRTKGVLGLLIEDPTGASEAARIVGPAAPLLRRAIRRATAGQWPQRELAVVELWCVVRALWRPDVLFRQLWFRYRIVQRCPLMRLTRQARRRLPDDRERWLAEAAATHVRTSFLRADGSPLAS